MLIRSGIVPWIHTSKKRIKSLRRVEMVGGKQMSEHLESVIKRVLVNQPIEEVFELFTMRMTEWWPLKSHSIGGEHTARCVFEGRVGGWIYEVQSDGTEATWGRVKEWDPPTAVAFSWYPGRAQATAQDVEVRFSLTADGTELELNHHGWERLGDQAQETREGYDRGWELVLGQFVHAARG
jgi:uncharacterized protein YndB with AHSA1/START domain